MNFFSSIESTILAPPSDNLPTSSTTLQPPAAVIQIPQQPQIIQLSTVPQPQYIILQPQIIEPQQQHPIILNSIPYTNTSIPFTIPSSMLSLQNQQIRLIHPSQIIPSTHIVNTSEFIPHHTTVIQQYPT